MRKKNPNLLHLRHPACLFYLFWWLNFFYGGNWHLLHDFWWSTQLLQKTRFNIPSILIILSYFGNWFGPVQFNEWVNVDVNFYYYDAVCSIIMKGIKMSWHVFELWYFFFKKAVMTNLASSIVPSHPFLIFWICRFNSLICDGYGKFFV